MIRKFIALITIAGFITVSLGAKEIRWQSEPGNVYPGTDTLSPGRALEPWTYSENFQKNNLGAWESYPLWQDNAYDQNFHAGEIVPGDRNISIIQKVEPYAHEDTYMGAEKLLNMYLVPGATVRFRYYIKTNGTIRFLKVRFAAGKYGKLDYTLNAPKTNKWTWATVNFHDFVRENPVVSHNAKVKVYALAFLAEAPDADPAMPIYFGLDDIVFKGARMVPFQFAVPKMYRLPEFEPYIPQRPYTGQDSFYLSGRWPVGARSVELEIAPYTDQTKVLFKGTLEKKKDLWVLSPVKLGFPAGLYLAKLKAFCGTEQLSETKFTIHIAPGNMKGVHPRLLFNSQTIKQVEGRLKEKQFQEVYDAILSNAEKERKEIPVQSLVFDLDQFPDANWLPSWQAFGEHIYNTGDALKWNALAYALLGRREAGKYAKTVMISLAKWPIWTSPWLIRRGRYNDHRMGTWSHDVALAYDLTYDLMTPDERFQIRKAIMDKIVDGAYQTYVYDNMVASNTSNWIGHIMGGALMNMAAILDDGPETTDLEPYFTGCMMKFYSFITHVTDSGGGAWGEGFGYNNYTFSNMSFSIPSIQHVFNIDVTAPLEGTYKEYIWGGLIKDKQWFGFGDSEDRIGSAVNWNYLLAMHPNSLLSWYCHYLKEGETFKDVLFNIENIPQESPFHKNPDRVFHKIGTTVFKSGWGKNDFAFVMRTGAFFNHQHLDQGSFWLADHGIVFIGDQPIQRSDYYKDPLYQSRFIQPIAHSTILINDNPQSQRVGDPADFAPGFEDHAFIASYLDGKNAAFSRGDIGRLYWGKVKSLSRNILYLKPAAILMLDVAVPQRKETGVTLLYQTAHLKDINAGQHISTITRDSFALNIIHLSPASVETKAVETPHYLNTLLKEKPLIKEGMLTVIAKTNDDRPLVMANLFVTTPKGEAPEVIYKKEKGFMTGTVSGKKFAFATEPGNNYHIEDIGTNALAITWDGESTFAAMATSLFIHNKLVLQSGTPLTFEFSGDTLTYFRNTAGEIKIGVAVKPSGIILNGEPVKNFRYDNTRKIIILTVPKGEGRLVIKK